MPDLFALNLTRSFKEFYLTATFFKFRTLTLLSNHSAFGERVFAFPRSLSTHADSINTA